jgi:hypothetical protein
MVSRAWLTVCTIGCGAPMQIAPRAAASDEITLYRDLALVTQRVDVVVPAAHATVTVAVTLGAGVGPDDLVILDRGELEVGGLRIAHAVSDQSVRPVRDAGEPTGDPPAPQAKADAAPDEPSDPLHASTVPTEVELAISAPRAGRFALALGYVTDRFAWDAAYTMTTSAARDRAVLAGAAMVRNASGIALHAHAYLVDAELGAWRDHTQDALRGVLAGVVPRDLGIIELGDGETRVDLLAGAAPRKMRSVLVYDPIGTVLDHPGGAPISDPAVGVAAPAPTRVTESFEVDRDERSSRGLPAGPLRLLERHPDGSLAVLGESRLGGASRWVPGVAGVDTVAIGIADAVVGHRERRDWARDEVQKRFSEEFLLTIDNARPLPVELVIREHLYRGQNWTLAYQSAPAAKEGPQQISLRTTVPANGRSKVLYVVVYTW